MLNESPKYLWMDLEMSGLDPENCRILEAAAVITDHNFQSIAEIHTVISQPKSVLDAMDEWCKNTHGTSGLTQAVLTKGEPESKVESDFLKFLEPHFKAAEPIVLCGNSIGQDRKFLDRYWPSFAKRLHYRMLDVSSFKVVFRTQYNVDYKKGDTHRAVDDIRESISELRHYLSFVNVPNQGLKP